MEKNIVGSWGADLSDEDYACALVALGALEFTGSVQHASTSEPGVLAEAIKKEFVRGERTVVWREAKHINPGTTVSSWSDTIHTNAAALAAAWRQYRQITYHARTFPRMAVRLDWRSRPDLFDFQALCEWLAHPAVHLGALTFEATRTQIRHRVGWHWPLLVGVLPGPDRPKLIDAVDLARTEHKWIKDLSRVFTIEGARDACDLLLVTSLDDPALRSAKRTHIRTSFVACLDDPPADLSAAAEQYGVVASNSKAAGVGWVGKRDTPEQIADWFEAVIREVSHDVPIATTLSLAGQRRLNRAPLIIGHAHALDMCRILAIADRQDRVVVALGGERTFQPLPTAAAGSGESTARPPSAAGATPDLGAEPTFGGPDLARDTAAKAPSPLRGIVGDLADQLRSRDFSAESVDGVQAVRDLRDRERAIDEAHRPRWIQVNGWRPDAPELAARSFAPRQWNLVGVHIGPSEIPRSDAPFPTSGIDFSQGDVPITVQIELAGAAVQALEVANLQSALTPGQSYIKPAEMRRLDGPARSILQELSRLELPPSTERSPIVGLASSVMLLPAVGDTTVALFAVCPEQDVRAIEGRIAVIHGNRVLQTGHLSIDTGAPFAGHGLTFVTDRIIHARDDDLEERCEYDVAIRVSDVGGKLHLAIQRDAAPTPVELNSLKGPIAAIRAALKAVAEQWDYSKPMLEQPVFDASMFTLSANGKALEQHLRKFFGDDIDRWERIHLLPFTNEFLPLEYVYAGPPPQVGARPCANLAGALRSGSCDQALSAQDPDKRVCPNQTSKAFVCPMKFWGFSRLIERSGTVRLGATEQPAQAPQVSTCVPSKHPYGSVLSLLFAVSDRAFNYATDAQAQEAERAGLVDALGALHSPIATVKDWDEWRTEAKKHPNLLVLVVHTDKVANVDVLEIGKQQMLGSHEILSDVTGATDRPLLLMLLGCSAAGVDENFQPYPELFRDAGASIVLAPIALIRGVDAVRIAKRLSKLIAQRLASAEPTSFGALLPILRRELLSEGYPGVMGVVGFGDGDWLLGGRDAAT